MSDFMNHGDKPIEFCGDQEGWIAVGSLTGDSPNSPCHPRVVLLGVGLGPSGKEHPSNIAAMLTVEQAADLRERLTAAIVGRPAPTATPALDLDAVEAAHARMTAGEWRTVNRKSITVDMNGENPERVEWVDFGHHPTDADLAGIVALRNAAPALIADVRSLRAKLAEAKRLGREACVFAASAIQVIDDEGIDDDNESPRVKRDLGRIAAALEAL